MSQVTSSHHQLSSCLTFTSSTSTTPRTQWTSRPPTGRTRVTRPPRWTTSSATTTTARWWTAHGSSPRESRRHPVVEIFARLHLSWSDCSPQTRLWKPSGRGAGDGQSDRRVGPGLEGHVRGREEVGDGAASSWPWRKWRWGNKETL